MPSSPASRGCPGKVFCSKKGLKSAPFVALAGLVPRLSGSENTVVYSDPRTTPDPLDRACPGHPRLPDGSYIASFEDVGGRTKSGHGEFWLYRESVAPSYSCSGKLNRTTVALCRLVPAIHAFGCPKQRRGYAGQARAMR
jgi:hypothetical protein